MRYLSTIAFLLLLSFISSAQQLETSTTENWVSNNWKNSYKNQYNYDLQGFLTGTIRLNWDTAATQWSDSQRNQYIIDSQGDIIQILSHNWDHTLSKWIPDNRASRLYDSVGHYAGILREQFINSSWQNQTQHLYSYNNNGQI